MAVIDRTFDITLTNEFIAYLQNIINEDWNGENPVVFPALAIKTMVSNPLGTSESIITAYYDGIAYSGYKIPLASSTTMTLGMIEDETEQNPPTLTGHLIIDATYSNDPGAVTITFEILAVRNEDFTPEVS